MRKRPKVVEPDGGERVESLAAWAEVYDPRGRLLGLLLVATPEELTGWARGRPAGSRYRVLVRGGSRVVLRLEVLVHPGRIVEIHGTGGGR